MILKDDKGNIFNVEAVIAHEDSPKQLKLLCKALYNKLIETEDELNLAIDCTEDSGVDWGEILEERGWRQVMSLSDELRGLYVVIRWYAQVFKYIYLKVYKVNLGGIWL